MFFFGVRYWWQGLYDVDNFNCVDMSKTVAPIFHFFGFDTKIIYAGTGNIYEPGHAWLSVNGIYFDAVSLWFNDEKEFPDIHFIESYPYNSWYCK